MKKYIALFSVTILSLLVFNGCKLSGGETTPPSAAFFVIHASPNAPNIDLIANGGLYAQNLAYGSDSGYYFVPPATYNLKIAAPTGSTTYPVDVNVTFAAGKYYSVFAVDSGGKLKAAVVEDVLSVPGADSVRLRFFQFSPNAEYLSAKFKNTLSADSVVYSGRTFNDQNSNSNLALFNTIKAGTYDLTITKADGSILKSFTGLVFGSSRSYTVYLRGFEGGTGTQALDKGITENVQ